MRTKATNRDLFAQRCQARSFVVRRIVGRDFANWRRGAVQTIEDVASRTRWTVGCIAEVFKRADCQIHSFDEFAHDALHFGVSL